MKSWLKNSVHSVNAAVLTTILSAEQAFGAGEKGILTTGLNTVLASTVVGVLVTGSCIAMGILEAMKIWKSMFSGSGGDIWKDVLALLGWIVFAVYWKDLLTAMMAAFTTGS